MAALTSTSLYTSTVAAVTSTTAASTSASATATETTTVTVPSVNAASATATATYANKISESSRLYTPGYWSVLKVLEPAFIEHNVKEFNANYQARHIVKKDYADAQDVINTFKHRWMADAIISVSQVIKESNLKGNAFLAEAERQNKEIQTSENFKDDNDVDGSGPSTGYVQGEGLSLHECH